MIEVNKNKVNVVFGSKGPVCEDVKPTKAAASDTSSYEDKDANIAVTNAGKALVKKKFKPAETEDELRKQILNTKWLNPEFKRKYSFSNLQTDEDIKTFSELWHKLDKLSPILQEKVNPDYLMMDYYNIKANRKIVQIKNFSVDKINQLNPELQKCFDMSFTSFLLGEKIDDPQAVNKLYNSLNDEYKQDIFKDYLNCTKSKDETEKMILKAECLNKLSPSIVKKVNATNIINTPLHIEHLRKQTDYLNSLPDEQRDSFSTYYLQDIFKKSFSYALDNNDNEPVCGTDKFRPFTRKEQLKNELGSMRNEKGEWQFNNDDINKIISNENDIIELSKILHGIKSNHIELHPYNLETLLMKEGITLRDIQTGLDIAKYIQEDSRFDEVKEKFLQKLEIVTLTKEEAENIKNNADLIEVLKSYNEEEFKSSIDFGGNRILDILKTCKLQPETVKNILKQDVFPKKLGMSDLKDMLKDETFNNIPPQNLKFINDLKDNPSTKFLFDGSGKCLNNYNIVEILKMDLPEDFELNEQKDMLKLLEYINSDKKTANIIDYYTMTSVKLLTQNGNFEDGKNLVNFLAENNLCDCNGHKYLITNSFKENLDLLKQIKDIPILKSDNTFNNYYAVVNYSPEEIQNVLDLVKYADKTNVFENGFVEIMRIVPKYEGRKKVGLESCNKEEIKRNIDNLVIVSKTMCPKMWDMVKNDALEQVLINDKLEQLKYKKENIEYFNKFIEDERTEKVFNIDELNELLQKDLDIDALNANYEDKFKFVEKYKDEVGNTQFVCFSGDVKKLEAVYEQLKKENNNEKVKLDIDENTNNVTFETENKVYQYDKDMNLLNKSLVSTKQKKDGELLTLSKFEDKKRNISNEITYRKVDIPHETIMVPIHMVSKYYDENGDVLKARIYDESGLDGVYNIKELYPNGKIKTLSSGYENSDGQFMEKNLESLDGTKSNILYNKDPQGNENYEYRIIDKDGNQLLDLKRTTEIIDKNTKITTKNDKKYEIKYSEDTIVVEELNNNNKKTTLNLKELNPKKDSVLKDLLESLPGDELLKVKRYVKELELTPRIESGMDPIDKKMFIGPHKFIFEHELGHAKDEIMATIEELANLESLDDLERKICSDKNLQEIFEEEKRLLKENFPEEITKEADYFINDTDHYGGKLGGLSETVAEVNAIQTTARFHPLLMMRTEVLQEYFPKTIAYLVNNSL